jgi:hypothetical protein
MSQWEAPRMRAIRIENELVEQCAQLYGAEQARGACRIQQSWFEARRRTSQIVLQILPFAIESLTGKARRYVDGRQLRQKA